MTRKEHDKLEIGDIIQFKGMDWLVWCIWHNGCSVKRGVWCEPIRVSDEDEKPVKLTIGSYG